jgi:aryl-alcohol dehydrogenase-like predicted oxidoreductase
MKSSFSSFSRRALLEALSAAIATAACTRKSIADLAQMQSDPPGGDQTMPVRRLGRTGVEVSLMGIGGAHLGVPSEKDAIRIVHEAMDHGVTFLDNCWDYGAGECERRMGKALRGAYRDKAFLMTKLDGRTAAAAAEQLEQSLRRLETDHVDLLQIHEVIRDSDPARVFAAGGAIEAFIRAREAGKTRFIGFTGHKSPAIHLAMLEMAGRHGFRFDTVQMPVNVMDAQYGDESFERRVLPVLLREEIGVLGMKPLGSGVLLQSHVVTPVECLRYAMSLPVSVTITGVDSSAVLQQDLHIALGFEPMTEDEKREVLAQAAAAAHTGKYEKYKTTTYFDGTTHQPRWLDSAQE